MKRRRFYGIAIALTVLSASSLGAEGDGCGVPPILENNGFDLWCGEELCSWIVEAGSIRKAPTWHKSDFGVEFVGPIAAISQATAIDSSIDCLRFRAVAKVDLNAIVTVEVDYFSDGTYDVEQRVPTSDWASIEFELPTPQFFRGATFRVRKEGSGQAILAEVQVTESEKCIEPPVVIADLENGERCADDGQCGSGVCHQFSIDLAYCVGCERSIDCGAGFACGVAEPLDPEEPLGFECGAEGRADLGEVCIEDNECGTGVCCAGKCSTCCTDGRDVNCSGACANATAYGPKMCGGADPTGAPSDLCFVNSQCISNVCTGAPFRICEVDGRICGDATDCPGGSMCVNYGIANGVCQ